MSCFHRQTWKQKYFYKIQRNMKPSVWSGNRFAVFLSEKRCPPFWNFRGGDCLSNAHWLSFWLCAFYQKWALCVVIPLCNRCKIVDYESLVLKPRLVLREILRFLRTPWSDSVMNHTGYLDRTGGILLSK